MGKDDKKAPTREEILRMPVDTNSQVMARLTALGAHDKEKRRGR